MAKRGRARPGIRPRRTRLRTRTRLLLLAIFVALGGSALYVASLLSLDQAVDYSSIEKHVKYGSTGSERRIGIPLAVFRALPALCQEYLPGNPAEPSYAAFGLIQEEDEALPVGFSRRRIAGMELVGVNCGLCHVGQVREFAEGDPRVFPGMPANSVDLGAFEAFLTSCVSDPRFEREEVMAAAASAGVEVGLIEQLRLRFGEFERAKQRLTQLAADFRFMRSQPDLGPGRVDTISATKAVFGLPLGRGSERAVGSVDFAALWLQGKKARMNLYWDGSNDSMQERNLLGAIHTGAAGTADVARVMRVRNFFEAEAPPAYPYPIREVLADRGAELYTSYCSECHGRSGRQFEGDQVGEVTPLAELGTDPGRLESYTEGVATAQRTLSPDGQVNFRRFKRTRGYANVPLDGIWLRAPYLHNGSVPTLRDLLEPSSRRPRRFYRGDLVYDPQRVGFVANVPERDGRRLFEYDTTLQGNGNQGHEGERYGTRLSDADKDALVEYLKRF